MILSTCNRVEVAVTADEQADVESAVEGFLADSRHVERAWVTPYLYRFDGPEAIRHLFRVASSLDSMVVGEPQILGQLKTAYALAKERGAVGGFLDQVMTRAFSVAKRVRSETDIGESAVSVSYAAVELAREIFGSSSRQESAGDRRRKNGRERGPSSSPSGRFRNPGDESHPRARRSHGRGLRRPGASNTNTSRTPFPKSISFWLRAARRTLS